jgi:hypothetical protein
MLAAKVATSTGWYHIGVSRDLARDGATPMLETVLKRFEEPDEIRTFEKGKFELVRIGGMTIGRATYQGNGPFMSDRA